MSQTEQQQPVDPHTAIYQHLCQEFSQHSMLYEYLSSNVIKLLPGAHAQAVEDALNMMCVSMSKTPLESLLLIHEFLSNYQVIMQHDKEDELPEESPYMMREEG